MNSPEASGADRGGDGRHSDGDHRSNANSGQQHRHRQRQLNVPEKLAGSETHRDGGFPHRRADARNPDIGVANHRQQRVERQGDDRQPVGTRAQPRQRQQQSKEREAGNRLHDICAAEHQRLPSRPARQKYPQRNADRDGEQHGNPDQPQMLSGQSCDFAFMGQQKIQASKTLQSLKHLLARPEDIHIRLHRIIRRLQEFAAAVDPAQPAFFHQSDAAAQQQGFADVVGHEDDGLPQFLLELLEFHLDLGPGDGIERAEGLVHEKDGRLGRQGARQPHPLPLSTGELMRIARGKFLCRQSNQRQAPLPRARRFCPVPTARAWAPAPRFRGRNNAETTRHPEWRSRSAAAT